MRSVFAHLNIMNEVDLENLSTYPDLNASVGSEDSEAIELMNEGERAAVESCCGWSYG